MWPISRKRSPKLFGVITVILGAWLAIMWLLTQPLVHSFLSEFPKANLEVTALIGDTFGAFSALMAAFAAVGAILALSEQRNAVKRQMFVTTLVAMLDRLQQTIQDTDFFVVEAETNADGTVDERIVDSQSGQSAFYEISQELRLFIIANTIDGMNSEAQKGLLVLLYPSFYEDYKDVLGHFFRQLYHIVRYIDDEGGEEKKRFMKIVRASLTNAQLLLLAYNVIAGEGRVKFSRLIERYSLLHNLGLEDDRLGMIERSLIHERLGERSLVSDSEIADRLERDFISRETANSHLKNDLRRFLDERGFTINLGVKWKNPA